MYSSIKLAFGIATCVLTINCHAASFTSFDPRSMAMGGTGVASAKPYNAAFFNPALLRHESLGWHERWFSRVAVGARLIDRENFIDSLDSYQAVDYEQNFQDALQIFNSNARQLTLTFSDARNVLNAVDDWANAIDSLSDKPMRASGAALLNIGFPTERFGFGLFARRRLVLGSIINISDADLVAINDSLNFLNTIVDIAESGVVPEEFQLELPDIPEQMTSQVEVRGADYQEFGFSFAVDLIQANHLQLGINLKRMDIDTFHYREHIQQVDLQDFDLQKYQQSYQDINLDLGFSGRIGKRYRWGLVAQNVISKTYSTVLGDQLDFSPVIRAGVAYESKHITYTMDYDITRNDPLGFDPDKQYVSFGTEFRLWSNTALRLGYRYNQVDQSQLLSAGLGLGFEYGHVDLAVAGKGDELGASLQLALHF